MGRAGDSKGGGRDTQAVFTEIHEKNLWRDGESRSGTGSNVEVTAAFRDELSALVRRLRVRTMLDIPCGDFNWMKDVDLAGVEYTGADIVPALVEANTEKHSAPGRRFVHLDLIADALPAADLIFCRDCLVHLPLALVLAALENIGRSRSKYLLTTTFPAAEANPDIRTGQWRRLNLERPPFNFPPPLAVIIEECPEAGGMFADKSLGLWRVRDVFCGE